MVMVGDECKCEKLKRYNAGRKTKIRFNEKDLLRIAKYVERDSGLSKLQIFAYIASAYGFGHLICKVSGVIQGYLSIISIIHKIALTMTVGSATKLIIEYLKGGKFIKVPYLNWVVIAVIVLIGLAEGILAIIGDMTKLVADADEISGFFDDACKAVDVIEGKAFEAADNTTGGAISRLMDKAHDEITGAFDSVTFPTWDEI